MILLVDYGSQTSHLIARRIKDLGIDIKIITPKQALSQIQKNKPVGIIFSGGPSSVYAKNAPQIDKKIFALNIPILGICYGQQLLVHLLGGKVKPGITKEYGPTEFKITASSPLFTSIPKSSQIWMSHGDEVVALPANFIYLGHTKSVKAAAIYCKAKKIYGLQFHPEVTHTQYGTQILTNFVTLVCKIQAAKTKVNLPHIISDIKAQVGKEKCLAAVSGGVDSTVAAAIVAKSIGIQLIPIYIDNGLMRLGTKERIVKLFKKHFSISPVIVPAQKIFLQALKGVIDPEKKRKIIGNLYIKLFEKQAKKSKAKYLVQGTIYSDVIESKGTKHADIIKSHHNVGGLPKKMQLKLIEPLRNFYKDEVKKLGAQLNIPEEILNQQPFPGPGQAIRIIGEINQSRLNQQQLADSIVMEEIIKNGWYKKVFQSFSILTNTKSTAVKGDGRFYGEVVAVRIYNSTDIMTAGWTHLPYDLLQKISSRIVNEVPGVSRVVYDITTKPPATMEWE